MIRTVHWYEILLKDGKFSNGGHIPPPSSLHSSHNWDYIRMRERERAFDDKGCHFLFGIKVAKKAVDTVNNIYYQFNGCRHSIYQDELGLNIFYIKKL